MPSKPLVPLNPTAPSLGPSKTVANPHFQFYVVEQADSAESSTIAPSPVLGLDRDFLPKDHPTESSLPNGGFSGEAEVLRILSQTSGQPASKPEFRAEDSFYVLQRTLADKKKMTEYKFIKTLADAKKGTSLNSKQSLPQPRDVSVQIEDHLIPCRELPIPLPPQAAPSIPQQKTSSFEVPAATVPSPLRNMNFSLLQVLDTAWRDHIDAIGHLRETINFYGGAEETSKQSWTAQKANEDHTIWRSLSGEQPEQNGASVMDSNHVWSWDTQVWSNALGMIVPPWLVHREVEVGGEAVKVGVHQFPERHGDCSETTNGKERRNATNEEDKSTMVRGHDWHDEQKEQSMSMPSSVAHEKESVPLDQPPVAPLPHLAQKLPGEDVGAECGTQDDDIPGGQRQNSDNFEDQKGHAMTTSSAVGQCKGSDALMWMHETMPVAASCRGPSASKEPVYLEALHHEMPRGLRKERNLKKFLGDEPKGPAFFGKVVDPSSKTTGISGMASQDLSQEDQDALKKMLQMWAPGPNEDDGGDLTSGIGHGCSTSIDAKTQKKSWAARCVPCRGKLPVDSDAKKPLRKDSAQQKAHRKGIFRFLPLRRNT